MVIINLVLIQTIKKKVVDQSLLSFSVYNNHTVLITSSGSLQGFGVNESGRIIDSLPKTIIYEFSEISVKDKNGQTLVPVSAVVDSFCTLYMFSRINSSEMHLAFSLGDGNIVFLDIGNK